MNKKRKKARTLALLMAAGLLLSTPLLAQDDNHQGGMLKPDGAKEHKGLFGRGGLFSGAIDDEDFGSTPEGDINVEDFGAPLGGGMLILLAAGAGYAALKEKRTNH